MRRNFFTRLYDLLIGDPSEYRKKHTSKVRLNKYYRWLDRDSFRSLQQFHVHGEPVMAYSRKDAIKRWAHADFKNRRRRSRRWCR